MKKTIFLMSLLLGFGILFIAGCTQSPVIETPADDIVVVPEDYVAVIVPAVEIIPQVPQVIFIGITTIAPLDVSQFQGRSSNIVVTFTEAMMANTINETTFTVKGFNTELTEGTITSDSTKKVWTFSPTDKLEANTEYTITISKEVEGISGNSLIEDFVWTFTTISATVPSTTPSTTPEVIPADPAVLTSIKLSRSVINMANGTARQFTVTKLDQYGESIAAEINYTSSNTSVATVNATGYVTALVAGNTTLTITSGAVTNSSTIVVGSVVVPSLCPAVSVDLGTSGNFVILAKSGISTTGATSVVGDMGISPAAASFITGFGLIMDASNTFSTSSLVTGNVYASDYTAPTPATMTTAISDMETAYTTANGLAPCVTELGAGDISGLTLVPGVYKWGTGLLIETDVTLEGNATDVWVFQVAGTLDLASAQKVVLSGGALAKNVYWVVGDTTTLGTTSVFNGNILDMTNIALLTGATLNGRALAQTAVTLQANPVTKSI